jgi:hypothetical protein
MTCSIGTTIHYTPDLSPSVKILSIARSPLNVFVLAVLISDLLFYTEHRKNEVIEVRYYNSAVELIRYSRIGKTNAKQESS